MRLIKSALILFGILLLINGILLALVANYNLGILLTIFMGIAAILWGVYYERINALLDKKLKWLKYVMAIGLVYMLGTIAFLAAYGQMDTVSNREDAIIILGAGIQGERVTLPLMQRLEQGILCLRQNPDAIIVVTGGRGPQEDITEALAMERYLLQRGVPQEAIIKEEQAKSTYENFTYSKEILDRHFDKPYEIVFITNDFHIYRASRYASIVGLSSTHQHAPTAWYSLPMSYLREFLAVVKLWVFRV